MLQLLYGWCDFSESQNELIRGEILRPRGGSVSQKIVFRFKEIGGIMRTNHGRNGKGIVSFYRIFRLELFFRSFERNISLISTYVAEHYAWCAEHYGVRKTMVCGTLWCAEHYGVRNTMVCGTLWCAEHYGVKNTTPPGGLRISP
jgi:hypothetical protein